MKNNRIGSKPQKMDRNTSSPTQTLQNSKFFQLFTKEGLISRLMFIYTYLPPTHISFFSRGMEDCMVLTVS